MTLSNTPLVTWLQERYCLQVWRFRGLLAVDLALTQGAYGEPYALRFAPPARAGQGKAPEDGFVFIEQNDLAAAGPILQGGKFK
jgi:hypothetical protein